MAIYGAGHFRVGFQHYVKYLEQSVRSVLPGTIADPAALTCNTVVGLASLPSASTNDNLAPVEAVGSARDLAYVPGRRECELSMRIQVSNAAFLQNVIRNHALPGNYKGMKYIALEYGACTEYGLDAYANQALDCMFNSVRFSAAEGQPLTAECSLWPTAILPLGAAQGIGTAVPTGADAIPITWTGISFGTASTDYRSILSNVSINISNSLERVGIRKFLSDGANELAISRTAYDIVPKMEKIQVSYTFKDDVPAALRSIFNLGTVTLTGEVVGIGAGRNTISIVINNTYLSRRSIQQANANDILSISGEMSAHGITINRGTT